MDCWFEVTVGSPPAEPKPQSKLGAKGPARRSALPTLNNAPATSTFRSVLDNQPLLSRRYSANEHAEVEGMSLHIYVSHTGQRLLADPTHILSPDALRTWIAEEAAIPASRQILMTTRGKNVKQQHLMTEAEIFVYDRQFTSADADPPSTFNRAKPSFRKLRDPPATITDENSLQSWQELFMARRTWALEVAETVRLGVESAHIYNDEIEVMVRSTAVALENMKNHVGTLQRKFETTQKWANESLQEHRNALDDWKSSLDHLQDVPTRNDLANILQRPSTPTRDSMRSDGGTLRDLADLDSLQHGADDLIVASKTFESALREIEDAMYGLLDDAENVQKYGQTSWQGGDTANSLLEESETLAKRVNSDYEEILRYQHVPKSVSLASRRALVHTRDLLPALQAVGDEIDQLLTSSVTRRNETSENCIQALREVSKIESRIAGLQNQISKLDLGQKGNDGLETINKVFELPTIYGSLLVEATRRAEWTIKVRGDMDALQEEVISSKEDELKRRRKWAKSMGDLLQEDFSHDNALLDLNLTGPENRWPEIGRDEVHAYIKELNALEINDAAQEVTLMLRALESTDKGRKQRPKAFKNGSVYDLGQSSILQGNEEVKSLQDHKARLEDKLRASDSRVRKLEDLLHRQSHLARPNSGNFTGVPDFDRHTPSPSPSPLLMNKPSVELSRKSSGASRRLSNHTPEEKVLVQRIVSLEADILRLQREAQVERRSSTESRDKMQEAESVKRDLMANFESQKQEFDDERQLLDDENQKLKIRIEELEDDLDRLAGSRDHQRINADKAISSLQEQIDRLRKTSAEELMKTQNKFETTESSLKTQRDRASSLDKQLQQIKDERFSLQGQTMTLANQLRDLEQERQDHVTSLQVAHSSLSPGGVAPDDLPRLVRAIEILSEGLSIHARGLDDALQLATAENKSLEEKVTHGETQIKRLESRVAAGEVSSTSLRETLARERGKFESVQAELLDEQAELKNLRTKFAAGETGSEALRERLVQAEKKVTELTQRAAAAEANAQSSSSEVESMKAKVEALDQREQNLIARLDSRGARAKELSERLFQHNDRMVRMLEQLGYAVSRPEDQDRLTVQRASKVSASAILGSTNADASAAMKRTISGALPAQHYADTSDLDTLYWTSDADAESEDSKFARFISVLSRLDLDSTVETITKRYKDVENLAKKYQKDSRGYREKSHRLQSEAHDKIAYRSFKEGDLALFLPTRNQAARPWAAFNVGAPHYFLREQDVHKLQSRDYLLARISRVEERVVDLSRSLGSNRAQHDRSSINTDASDGASTRSVDDENPFELSDGLRWYMIDASEEKPGAPTTPGLGKSTAAVSNVEVKGSMGKKSDKTGAGAGNSAAMVTKTLNRSLDSRRSSSGSKAGHAPSPSLSNVPAPLLPVTNEGSAQGHLLPTVKRSDSDLRGGQPAREEAQVFDVDGSSHVELGDGEQQQPQKSEIGSISKSSPLKGIGLPLPLPQTPSPVKQQLRTASPAKQATPSKARPWDKLWGIEYKMEEGPRP